MSENVIPLFPGPIETGPRFSFFQQQEHPMQCALNPAGHPGWLFRCTNSNGQTVEFCRATTACAKECLQQAYSRGYSIWCRVYVDSHDAPFHECPTWEMALKLSTIFPLGKFITDIDE